MTQSKIGIVIVTFNSENFINECLLSVTKIKHPQLKIIISDNSSDDNTLSVVRKHFPNVHIIKNDKNLGYAGGNNMGIKYLLKKKYDYILLLNPDTKVRTNLIDSLLIPFSQDKKIRITGSIITYMNDKKKIWFAGGRFNKLFCFTTHPHMDKYIDTVKIFSGNVDFITGACMMIKSEVFNVVGLLPEKYFLYFEDTFFCQKVISANFTCYLVAEPLLFHEVSVSTGEKGTNILTPLRAYYYARNPLLYIKNEVKGIYKIPNYFGQFFIRFPYYLWQNSKQLNFKSISSYPKGLIDGVIKQ